MATPNPPFSLSGKRRIDRAVRKIEAVPADYRSVERPAYPRAAGARVWVKPTSNASGGGKYNGRALTPPLAVASGTGDLAEADIGTDPGGDEDVLILNSREAGKSTHDIEFTGFLPLVFPGDVVGTTADGKRVVRIDGYQWEDC